MDICHYIDRTIDNFWTWLCLPAHLFALGIVESGRCSLLDHWKIDHGGDIGILLCRDHRNVDIFCDCLCLPAHLAAVFTLGTILQKQL